MSTSRKERFHKIREYRNTRYTRNGCFVILIMHIVKFDFQVYYLFHISLEDGFNYCNTLYKTCVGY